MKMKWCFELQWLRTYLATSMALWHTYPAFLDGFVQKVDHVHALHSADFEAFSPGQQHCLQQPDAPGDQTQNKYQSHRSQWCGAFLQIWSCWPDGSHWSAHLIQLGLCAGEGERESHGELLVLNLLFLHEVPKALSYVVK